MNEINLIDSLSARNKELEAKNEELEKKLGIAVEVIKELQSIDGVPHLDHHFEFLAAIKSEGL